MSFRCRDDRRPTVWAADRLVVVLEGWYSPRMTTKDLEAEIERVLPYAPKVRVLVACGTERLRAAAETGVVGAT